MTRSLRQRLAQFDRQDAAPERRGAADPTIGRRRVCADLVEAGAQWVGAPPQGYLRRVEELELDDRSRIDPSFFARAGLPLPAGEGPWVILDTETTGLDSGTGTVVFLVGLLRWRAGHGELVQLFLPEPAGEARYWEGVEQELADCQLLVSYNGKSFDLPRMRTRMRLHRRSPRALELPHADLLHPTRCVTRTWLESSRLAEIERGLLGIVRRDDLPGSMAPDVYRSLQVEGEDTGLADVLRHNRDDVVHLSRLMTVLAELHSSDGWRTLPGVARYDLARSAARRGGSSFALELLESLDSGESAELRARARQLAAVLRRRRGEYAAAESELVRSLQDRPSALDTRVQLAKLYEHHLRDLPRAYELTRESLELVARRSQWGRTAARRTPETIEALLHRKRRLERKLRRLHGNG